MIPHTQTTNADTVLARLDGVGKRYGSTVALRDASLRVRPGEVLALLGENGAGKTTAIGILLGLLQADDGVAETFGGAAGRRDARLRSGVMLQSAAVPETAKVGEVLELTRSYYPSPRGIQECVAMAGLDGLLQRPYGTLSGGQQRRVQFAMAICGNPRLLFLDEPTTGLDVGARKKLWDAIRQLVADGAGVLLTTHYLEEAEALADRVVVLSRGRVVAEGRMQEVRARVAQSRICCRTSLAAEALANWAGVTDVRANEGTLELLTDAPETVLRRLLAEEDSVSELEVRRAALAEAFAELTREPAAAEEAQA